jgi:hypothetical protein
MTTSLYNIQNFGAIGDGQHDDSGAIQLALDTASKSGKPSQIYVPGTTNFYRLQRPLWIDGDHVWLRGDGEASRLASVDAQPVLLAGVRRNLRPGYGGALQLPDGSFPSSNAVLDNSVMGCCGLRTRDTAHLAFPASPALLGSLFKTVAPLGQLTIEFCVFNNRGWKQSESYPLLGCMENTFDRGWAPTPWDIYLNNQDSRVHLRFRLSDGTVFDTGWGVPPDVSLQRWAIQINFSSGSIQGFQNGLQVSVDRTLPPGSSLGESSDFAPFRLGASGRRIVGNEYYSTVPDLSWFGLKLSDRLLYKNQGLNLPSLRLDGQPVLDLTRYFQADPHTIFQLPLNQFPNPQQLVPYWSSWGSGTGFFLTDACRIPAAVATETTRISDLYLQSYGNRFGIVLGLGLCLKLDVENCTLDGGAFGLGALPLDNSYPVTVRRCNFRYHNYAAIQAFNWLGHIQDCDFLGFGDCAIAVTGSSLTLQDCFSGESGRSRHWLRCRDNSNGGRLDISGICLDYEGYAPSQSYFYIEPQSFTPGSQLRVSQCDFGRSLPKQPLILLRSPPGSPNYYKASYARFRQNNAYRPFSATVRCEGAPWSVSEEDWAIS